LEKLPAALLREAFSGRVESLDLHLTHRNTCSGNDLDYETVPVGKLLVLSAGSFSVKRSAAPIDSTPHRA